MNTGDIVSHNSILPQKDCDFHTEAAVFLFGTFLTAPFFGSCRDSGKAGPGSVRLSMM